MTAIPTEMLQWPPPELLHSKGTTVNSPGDTHWKYRNPPDGNARLPQLAFRWLSETQASQVSISLANADHLPEFAKSAPAGPL